MFIVQLESGSNIFLWDVTMLLPELSLRPDLQSDFERRQESDRWTIQLKIIFNDFFPDISPIFLVISPKFRSTEVSPEGRILMPRWEGTSIMDYLEQVVKHLLSGADTRLEI